MGKDFKGKIALDIRDSVPDWEPYKQPQAPEGSPNILYIVIDDTGFGAWEMYGGKITMPALVENQGYKSGMMYRYAASCSFT